MTEAAWEAGSNSTSKREPSSIPRRVGRCARRSARGPGRRRGPTSTVTVPDSILARSRMSLISLRRSLPADWMVSAYSTCRGSSGLPDCRPAARRGSACCCSGVRSSCDMLARNSDLYFDVRASCRAFSSSAWRVCSTSSFLRSTSAFCSARRAAFSSSEALLCCSSSWRLCSSARQRLRLLQQPLRPAVRLDGVEHDPDALDEQIEELVVRRAEALEGGQLDHGLHLALEENRQHDDVQRRRRAEAGRYLDVVRRNAAEDDLLLFASSIISPSVGQPSSSGV